MKNTLAVIAGLIVSIIIFSLFEYLSNMIHPFPKDLDMANETAMKEYVSTLPSSALLIILAGYAIGSFVAGLVIGSVSKSSENKLPFIAGSILTIAAIINLAMIPHPIWFMIINLLLYIPLTIAGNSITGKSVSV